MSDESSLPSLPSDVAGCQALIEELQRKIKSQVATIESHNATIDQLQAEKQELHLRLNALLQQAFARRSERYLQNPDQLRLDFGDSDAAADAAEGLNEALETAELLVSSHTRRTKRNRSTDGPFPEHFPRYEIEAEATERQQTCPIHGARTLIGYDTTETLEMEPLKFRVRVTKYPKYACPNSAECGVTSPERPTGLVEGNRYDTSVATEVLTKKYGFHLPIYRQQDLFAGSGWSPGRSTLLNLLTAAAFVLRPLVAHLRQIVLDSDLLGTDDTTVTLLIPKSIPPPVAGDPRSERAYQLLQEASAKGKVSVIARMWAYRSVMVPLTFFDFTVSRERAGPDLVLQSFRGKLMADCYAGYQNIHLRSEGRIERGACVAHARRKVLAGLESYPRVASDLLARFQQLFDIEDRAKHSSAEQRLELRIAESKPIWNELGQWLDSSEAREILPKGKLGEALGYLRNHWEPLQLYLTDGRMPMDNHDVEQLMKQVAVGRKNWLFSGSVAAGERAADFLTIVSSALRNDLDVWSYVKDVLDQLLAGETDYDRLRPDRWRASHPAAIRQYRIEERRDIADRKQRQRALRRRRNAIDRR